MLRRYNTRQLNRATTAHSHNPSLPIFAAVNSCHDTKLQLELQDTYCVLGCTREPTNHAELELPGATSPVTSAPSSRRGTAALHRPRLLLLHLHLARLPEGAVPILSIILSLHNSGQSAGWRSVRPEPRSVPDRRTDGAQGNTAWTPGAVNNPQAASPARSIF